MKKTEKTVNIPVGKSSEGKLQEFATKLQELQKQYNVNIYAANQTQQNGEVIPIVKIIDLQKYEN